MKYSSVNPPLVCMQTNSKCYKGTSTMKVLGVLWHSTGANNPTLKRYVQPINDKDEYEHKDNSASNKKLLDMLGRNSNGNDWNHIDRSAGLNCWIGKLADGTVTTVQTMPWDYKPWGCGATGLAHSCNEGWIQFEICEDNLLDKDYFEKAYKEACEITAYLCKQFNIDPFGKVSFYGKQIPTILCHQDAYQLGVGGNHGDIYNWFPKHGKNMDNVRTDVAALLTGADQVKIQDILTDKVTATTAKINFKINEGFDKYKWSYNLTNLNTKKTESNLKFSVKSTTPSLSLKTLTPNSSYSLEIKVTDEFDHSVTTPGYFFRTEQDFPEALNSVELNLASQQIIVKPPNSWGDVSNRQKGYSVNLIVNGSSKYSSDSLLKHNSTANEIKLDLADLINKVSLMYGDTFQVTITPWVVDERGEKVYSKRGGTSTKPLYYRATQPLFDKIFVKVQDKFQRAILFIMND